MPKKPTTRLLKGHPTHFKNEFVELARKFCKLGATSDDLADLFKVTRQTIHNWTLTNPAFFDALKVGKEIADGMVEKSLFQRAMGYSHPAVKIFANPKTGENVKVDYIERYPPDTTACIFWLKNRRRDEWRDRGTNEGNDLTPEQLAGLVPSPKLSADETGPKAPRL